MIYRIRSEGGEWLWELLWDNGRVAARSVRTYSTEAYAIASAQRAASAQSGFYDIWSENTGIAAMPL